MSHELLPSNTDWADSIIKQQVKREYKKKSQPKKYLATRPADIRARLTNNSRGMDGRGKKIKFHSRVKTSFECILLRVYRYSQQQHIDIHQYICAHEWRENDAIVNVCFGFGATGELMWVTLVVSCVVIAR